MKLVQADEIEFTERVHMHRKGKFRFRRLLEGVPGTPGNFLLEMVDTTDDFFSPRHRHNFDQFRYQLEGDFDFDRNGHMVPGVIGYFPEGTHYGPQTSADHSLVLVMQFGGASGNGYMTDKQLHDGTAELKAQGAFESGAFKRDGKNIDGYQAVWEHVHGRPMVYPKQRYHDPLMMEPQNFAWVPVAGAPGVEEKLMGVFTERRTEAKFVKLAKGATVKLEGRRIHFVLSGAGTVDGKAFRKWSVAFLETGEHATLTATEPTELMVWGLPQFDAAPQYAAAAE